MSGDDENLETILKELGYVSQWLTYHFVDEPFLREQATRYRMGLDRNSEHYRWAAFLRVLEAHPRFDDTTLSRYVELVAIDPDPVMATSALIRLIRKRHLTDAQESWLRAQLIASAPVVQRAFDHSPKPGRGSAIKQERVDRPRERRPGKDC